MAPAREPSATITRAVCLTTTAASYACPRSSTTRTRSRSACRDLERLTHPQAIRVRDAVGVNDRPDAEAVLGGDVLELVAGLDHIGGAAARGVRRLRRRRFGRRGGGGGGRGGGRWYRGRSGRRQGGWRGWIRGGRPVDQRRLRRVAGQRLARDKRQPRQLRDADAGNAKRYQ